MTSMLVPHWWQRLFFAFLAPFLPSPSPSPSLALPISFELAINSFFTSSPSFITFTIFCRLLPLDFSEVWLLLIVEKEEVVTFEAEEDEKDRLVLLLPLPLPHPLLLPR